MVILKFTIPFCVIFISVQFFQPHHLIRFVSFYPQSNLPQANLQFKKMQSETRARNEMSALLFQSLYFFLSIIKFAFANLN